MKVILVDSERDTWEVDQSQQEMLRIAKGGDLLNLTGWFVLPTWDRCKGLEELMLTNELDIKQNITIGCRVQHFMGSTPDYIVIDGSNWSIQVGGHPISMFNSIKRMLAEFLQKMNHHNVTLIGSQQMKPRYLTHSLWGEQLIRALESGASEVNIP